MKEVTMRNKFKVGDRVGAGRDEAGELTTKIHYGGEYDDGPAYGTVKEILPGGKVKVLWDTQWLNERTTTYNEKTGAVKKETYSPATVATKLLLSEADAKAKFSELEKEYEVVAEQVRAKLKEAGSLIKDANKLAKKLGTELAEMYDATDPLENAMDACGWRTSSLHC
jgi:hypothetical protein